VIAAAGESSMPVSGLNEGRTAGYPTMRSLLSFLSGRVGRRTLLFLVLPAIFVSYFVALGIAMRFSPGPHEWRSETISKLLDRPRNPRAYWIASAGITVAGWLAIPFAGYIGRRLRAVAPIGSRVGTVIFGTGAAGVVLSGLIAYHGNARFPRLHTLLARGSAFALGVGMMVFWACLLAGCFRLRAGTPRRRRALAVVWTLLILSGPTAAVLSVLAVEHRIREPAGLWEWIASAVLFLFLLFSAWLLPGTESENAVDPAPTPGR
jgi:hypothetical protein